MSAKGKEKQTATATNRINGVMPLGKDNAFKTVQTIPPSMQSNAAVQRTASFAFLPKHSRPSSISANRTNDNTALSSPAIPPTRMPHTPAMPVLLNQTQQATRLAESTPSIRSNASIASRDPAHEELELLHDSIADPRGKSRDHELRTAPIITRDAYVAAGYREGATQYGVLGSVLSIHHKNAIYKPVNPQLYVNTNAPFSAVVCGVQGSGKSHTVSLLLESMFIPNMRSTGTLQKPLAGLVLHFGEGGPNSRPCEAAWIGSSHVSGVQTPAVKVYVSRSSLNTMKAVYASLGGAVTVEPLLFSQDELDAQAFLSMMAVGSSESAPLYIQGILSILRDLGEDFTYPEFLRQLEVKKESFNPAQIAGLEQRMALLNSFMNPHIKSQTRFAESQLTIIDLSDPFIDPASACGLFEIITRLFVRADVGTGKVLVVDEAHKYLSPTKSASGLTKSLLTLTREQRHLAMRVIISTQEPTVVPPVLLDLCTVAILHRFSSPSWWDHLAKHVSADISADDAFDRVVKLQTGEAILLAPSGYGVFPDAPDTTRPGIVAPVPKLNQFGRRYVLVKTRRRVTKDGGASILVVDE
ncbi:hypothetical protein K503DRAFT_766314 [Rhizopogon vinicolor AM-OR11-026]|uniref:Zona occludens toxin N-terminal domain-containing protein n=1 Tax=Rhizopogon vinicolor AM-OR11-026 TaxID=1314800 RepID=A0A1B7NDL0_9AGAM|nr:hypothetical protein K503DRAFT_766314 [Rhizopogon vinicolor AM-OR11-026]